jgi:general secretion pathway protein L
MIRDFFRWWAQNMLDLLPDRFWRTDAVWADAILIHSEGALDEVPPTVDLVLRKGGQTSPIGRFMLDTYGKKLAQRAATAVGGPMQIWLRLPPGLLLEKHLTLPLAAERELASVLAFEMDRETPFSADEVYWDSTVEHRDRAQGRLTLRLSLVPRAPVLPLVTALADAGLAPTMLNVGLPNGTHRQIGLAGAKALSGTLSARAVPLAAAACAALAVLVIVLPFVRQSVALGAAEARIASLKPAVEEAEGLRRRIEGNGAGSDVVAAERARLGDPLKVIAAATQILPDDTHLTDFTMRQRKLSLVGQSAGAAKLIGALAQDRTFQDPAFSAPVTRMEGGKTDVFSISAEARP